MEKKHAMTDIEIEKTIQSFKEELGNSHPEFELSKDNMLYREYFDSTNHCICRKVLFLKEYKYCYAALFADVFDCEVIKGTCVLESFNKLAHAFDFANVGKELEEETGICAKDILSMFRQFRFNRDKN